VERHGETSGCVDQRPRSTFIYSGVRLQRTYHEPVGAERRRHLRIASHDIRLGVGVHEAAAAGTQDDEHGNAHCRLHGGDHPSARRGATIEQGVTQLQTVCASAFGGDRRLD
jgi:hypothetical protein